MYLPTTFKLMNIDVGGCTDTWHSYNPASLNWTYLICNVQSWLPTIRQRVTNWSKQERKKRWESNENKFNELTTCGTKNILSLPQILLIVLHWIAHRCCTYSCWPSADDNLSSVSRIPVRRVDTRKKKERKRRKYKINLRLFWTMKYTEIGQQKWIFFPLSVVLIGNEKTSETHVPTELKLHAFDRI